jgi:hypothetical protein
MGVNARDAVFNKNIPPDGYTFVMKTGDGKDIAINAGKDYPIDMLKKIRSDGYNGQKVKNAQAFGLGELKPKKQRSKPGPPTRLINAVAEWPSTSVSALRSQSLQHIQRIIFAAACAG